MRPDSPVLVGQATASRISTCALSSTVRVDFSSMAELGEGGVKPSPWVHRIPKPPEAWTREGWGCALRPRGLGGRHGGAPGARGGGGPGEGLEPPLRAAGAHAARGEGDWRVRFLTNRGAWGGWGGGWVGGWEGVGGGTSPPPLHSKGCGSTVPELGLRRCLSLGQFTQVAFWDGFFW